MATAVGFTDVTEQLGLDFRHQTGSGTDYPMPAIMGGGAAVFDYDDDGRLDLYLVNSGDRFPATGTSTAVNRLYHQEADGSFRDTTERSGLDDAGYGMGCVVGDLDNDGDLDVYVTNWGHDALYRNDGDGTFTDVTAAAGVAAPGWSTSGVVLDYDRDGWLDLYLARYVRFSSERECAQQGGRRDYCGPTVFPGTSDVLLRNLGGLRFEDKSHEAGITAVEDAGLGVVAADFDDDGWIDVYVANDADPNNLWINQRDGTFVDDGVPLGAAFNRFGTAQAGMGVSAGDADEDGDLDLFVTNLITETNTYYRNFADLGTLGFEDATAAAQLGASSLDFTGFGTAFFDYDNDGDLDLGVANGGVKRRPASLLPRSGWLWHDYAEPNLLFANLGDGTFAEVSQQSGAPWSLIEVSRALIPADLDRDGDLDLLLTNLEGPARILRNDLGTGLRALSIRTWDPTLRREAIGARVVIETSERRFLRHAIPPGGYLSSGHGVIHFAPGDAEVKAFDVRWPDGTSERFEGSWREGPVELRKGEGTPV